MMMVVVTKEVRQMVMSARAPEAVVSRRFRWVVLALRRERRRHAADERGHPTRKQVARKPGRARTCALRMLDTAP